MKEFKTNLWFILYKTKSLLEDWFHIFYLEISFKNIKRSYKNILQNLIETKCKQFQFTSFQIFQPSFFRTF